MTTRVELGPVHHFSLAVADPDASAAWWTRSFDLDEWFRRDSVVAIGNAAILLVLFKGEPNPTVVEHMGFHVKDMATLRSATELLKQNGVSLEDPGDEIGPVGPGSASMGVWFHDIDGYRWELFLRG